MEFVWYRLVYTDDGWKETNTDRKRVPKGKKTRRTSQRQMQRDVV